MKKIIPFILCLCLLLGGCSESTATANGRILLDNIELGITTDELIQKLEEKQIELITDQNDSPIPDEAKDAPKDGRIYNMTDLSFYYDALGYDLIFTFSFEGNLIGITCRDENILTPKGFAVGNTLDTAKKMYGSGYTEVDEGVKVIQYNNDGEYFNLYYDNGIVTAWSINLYQNINND